MLYEMEKFGNDLDTIIDIIDRNDITDFKKYVQIKDKKIKVFTKTSFDILIYAIEHRASQEIIKLILPFYDTLQYTLDVEHASDFYISKYNKNIEYQGLKNPLFSAIALNELKIADILINSNADINYTLKKRGSSYRINIFNYLNYIQTKFNKVSGNRSNNDNTLFINKPNVKYILKHGFNYTNMNSIVMKELLNLNFGVTLLDVIFKYYIYNNSFILKLLLIYKNKVCLKTCQLEQILVKEKRKLPITGLLYKRALKTVLKERLDIIRIIFYYDTKEPNLILNKFFRKKYIIIEEMCLAGEYSLLKIVLSQSKVKLNVRKIENIFAVIIHHNKYPVLKFSIELLSKNSNFRLVDISFKNLLLIAVHNDNFYKKSQEEREKNKKIILLLLQYILHLTINDETINLDVSLLKEFDQSSVSLILNAFIRILHLPLITYLLENEEVKSLVDINIHDNNNIPIYTALNNICYVDDEKYYLRSLEIFKYLLIKGADGTIHNKNEQNLWSAVLEKKDYRVMKCLLENCNYLKREKGDYNNNDEKTVGTKSSYSNATTANINTFSSMYHPSKQYIHKTGDIININKETYNLMKELNKNFNNTGDQPSNHRSKSMENIIYSIHVVQFQNSIIEAIYQNNLDKVQSIVKEYQSYINHLNDNNGNIVTKIPFTFTGIGNHEFTPLILSYLLNHLKIFNWLIKYVDINEKDKYGNTVLFYSVVKGDINTVKFLIKNKIKISNENDDRAEDIELGNESNSLISIESSHKRKRESGFNDDDQTLLVKRSRYNNDLNSQIFNIHDCYPQESLLHISICLGYKEIFISLLDCKGVNVNVVNTKEETPLISLIQCKLFSMSDQLEMIKKLITKGANVRYINPVNGKSPMDYAIESHCSEIIELLKK